MTFVQLSVLGAGQLAPTIKHVRIATPSYSGQLTQAFADCLDATETLLRANGWNVSFELVAGDCYVQRARNELTANFMRSLASDLFFIDDDIVWNPADVLRLLEMRDDMVFGAYPFKRAEVGYPVVIMTDANGYPVVRGDGCIAATGAPTGFLRIKRAAIEKMIDAYPGQRYGGYEVDGKPTPQAWDLFAQGVHEGRWWGEDLAFCRLWTSITGEIWCVPDIDLKHVARDGTVYAGNYHNFLLAQPRHDAAA